MESELNGNWANLKYDFEKLLVANAKYRIFLCCLGNRNLETCKKNFDEIVIGCNNLKPEDRVLYLIWDDCIEGIIYAHVIVKR
jgi:hypothetical protein